MATTKRKSSKTASPLKQASDQLSTAECIRKIARDKFRFVTLRPGQEEAISALLDGSDCLVVMPTGSGKSAILSNCGIRDGGATLVISPLIALQKDQVESINEQTDGEVVVNSTLRVAEARQAFEKIEEGDSKFIFLAPEQLRKQETVELLEKAGASLFAIDEAHCISEWGHDFRPDYLQLGPMMERLGHPMMLAMTATASAPVREEIAARLRLRNAKIFVHGFDRPNIHLGWTIFRRKRRSSKKLIQRASWAEKPGIVYVATRKNAEEIMRQLAEEGVKALFYHGGLKASELHEIQEQFMEGEADVIVATNAFGMGIDKADVRFVYHFDVSDSLDSCYQEIGRAGRYGEKAEAILFFRQQDMGVQKFHSAEGKLEIKDVQKVTNVIADQEAPVDLDEISDETDLSDRKVTSVVHRLEDVGTLEILPSGEIQVSKDIDTMVAAQAAAEAQEHRKEMKQERLRHMQEYADVSSCRREHLLRYFGDNFAGPCHNCDNCDGKAPRNEVEPNVGTRREVA
ncbi:MAG: RecQ family ATP-dependent DNA helicase [Acidobacteriota bacterium]|nr:RecQ family ATP-dependent DNA helicase [Acidobacteriota bacterium]